MVHENFPWNGLPQVEDAMTENWRKDPWNHMNLIIFRDALSHFIVARNT
jgi:hypothetical protein